MDTLTVQVWKTDFSDFRSPAAKLVALALARRGRESGLVWAKQSTLAADCGVSKQTVHRCLEELEAAGWIKREARFNEFNGSRITDMIWLIFPAVTLDCATMDRKELVGEARSQMLERASVDSGPISESGGPLPPSGDGPISESKQKESSKDSIEEDSCAQPDSKAIGVAVDLIWTKASKMGRQRSSKADIEKALRAALGRGHEMERILRGMGAYFASHDATKDDGAFQRGAHSILVNDRWASFLDDEKARVDRQEAVTPQVVALTEELGTLEEPSPKRQRHWMDLFRQGMSWDSDRGPQPGRMGCRVDPAIQREYGVTPWQDQQLAAPPPPVAEEAPPGDDAAAFD